MLVLAQVVGLSLVSQPAVEEVDLRHCGFAVGVGSRLDAWSVGRR